MVFGGLALLGFLVTLLWLMAGCCRICCRAQKQQKVQAQPGTWQPQFFCDWQPSPAATISVAA